MPSFKWIRWRTGLLCQWEMGRTHVYLSGKGKYCIFATSHEAKVTHSLNVTKICQNWIKKLVSGIEPKITLRHKTNRFIFATKQCLISFLRVTSPLSFPRSVFFVWRATSTLFTCFSFIENSRQSFHPLWSFSCFRLHFYSQKAPPIYNSTTRQSPEGLSPDVAEPVFLFFQKSARTSYCPHNPHWLDLIPGFSVPVEPLVTLELNGTRQIPIVSVQHSICLPRCTHITHFHFTSAQ